MLNENSTTINDKSTAREPDVWVKLDPLADTAIEEVNEDSDLILVVGDADIDPKYHYTYKPSAKNKNTDTRKHERKTDFTKSRYMHCDHCNFKSKNRASLVFHIKTNHMTTEPLQCSFCDYSSNTTNNLKLHIKHQHDLFECTECSYKTIMKQNFLVHKKQHKDNIYKHYNYPKEKISYKCSKCTFVTMFKNVYVRHQRQKHDEKVENRNKCEYCNYVAKRDWGLRYHTRKSLKNYLITCKECDFESWYNCEYKLHKMSHRSQDNSENTPVSEQTSDDKVVIIDGVKYPRKPKPKSKTLIYNDTKQFLINKKLELHRTEISVNTLQGENKKDRIFQCTQCTYESWRKEFVKLHFLCHHTDNSVKPYLCINCDFATKNRSGIRKHSIINKSEELLKCKRCAFTTYIRCLLAMHERTHKRYKCTDCALRFYTRQQMDKHYEVHTKSEYHCDLCSYTTNKKSYIINHLTKHTGKKNNKYKSNLKM